MTSYGEAEPVNSIHFRIMGNYHGHTEEIDHTESESTARYLQGEYQLAFGTEWKVWVEVQTYDHTGTLDDCYPLQE